MGSQLQGQPLNPLEPFFFLQHKKTCCGGSLATEIGWKLARKGWKGSRACLQVDRVTQIKPNTCQTHAVKWTGRESASGQWGAGVDCHPHNCFYFILFHFIKKKKTDSGEEQCKCMHIPHGWQKTRSLAEAFFSSILGGNASLWFCQFIEKILQFNLC